VGASGRVYGNAYATGAFSIAARAEMNGDTNCVSAVAIGANSKYTGNVYSGGAFTAGASSKMYGNIESIGAVVWGPNGVFDGDIVAASAITFGLGTTRIDKTAIPTTPGGTGATPTLDTCALAQLERKYVELLALVAPAANVIATTPDVILTTGVYENTGAWAFGTGPVKRITFDGEKTDGTDSDSTFVIKITGASVFAGDMYLTNGAQAKNIVW
jgi:hypothetical protein